MTNILLTPYQKKKQEKDEAICNRFKVLWVEAENSVKPYRVVCAIAKEFGDMTPNGVIKVLRRAGIYSNAKEINV